LTKIKIEIEDYLEQNLDSSIKLFDSDHLLINTFEQPPPKNEEFTKEIEPTFTEQQSENVFHLPKLDSDDDDSVES
jgi:hypothetical protein